MGATANPRRMALGRYGEELAGRHLLDSGYEVVDRNWRCPAGEIDIVAVDGECLVVCEVKTRSSGSFGTPEEAVTWSKGRRLRALATLWLAERCADVMGTRRFAAVRVDVVAVSIPHRGAPQLRHLQGVC